MAKDAGGHGSEARGGSGVSSGDVPNGVAHQAGVAQVGQQNPVYRPGQMKMSSGDYASLSAAVRPHMASTADPTHSAMRQRWDAMNKSGFDTRPLYKAGLNDDHIDTALRKIQNSGPPTRLAGLNQPTDVIGRPWKG